MAVRACRPLLKAALQPIRQAVGVAYAAGFLSTSGIAHAEGNTTGQCGLDRTVFVADPRVGRLELSNVGRMSTEVGNGENNSKNSGERERERIRFASNCAEGPFVGVSSSATSCANIEGIVRRVEMGYAGLDVVLQLILEVEEPAAVGDQLLHLPLAVRWRPGSDAKRELVDAWCHEMERFVGRRVLACGRLQIEECFEPDTKQLYKTPCLVLPSTPSLQTISLWAVEM
uniref:Uncharacterized protein TCIL3000_10_4270 n=1 Tax=Trypanosoma congolense (strain IL3000) TaxID=1068625 RepID=G0UW98_TRYCI|nr:unnamed protein product [Trypanosoma congolense IL3000]